MAPRSTQARRNTSPTSPRLSSTRFKTGSASSMNRHISSRARSGRVSTTFSTISWRCRSRSFTKARRFSQSMTDRACRSLVSRLPKSTLDPGVPHAELKQDFGQSLGTERFEVGEVDRLLRGHPLHFPFFCLRQPTASYLGEQPFVDNGSVAPGYERRLCSFAPCAGSI